MVAAVRHAHVTSASPSRGLCRFELLEPVADELERRLAPLDDYRRLYRRCDVESPGQAYPQRKVVRFDPCPDDEYAHPLGGFGHGGSLAT